MNIVIDAHHHLWKYTPAEYGWIGSGMEKLRRDFLIDDLQTEAGAAGVQGAISVQARQTLEETNWLLELAANNNFIRGVVGWAPLIDPALRESLEDWKSQKKLLGLRHVLQDETEDQYMLRPDFNRGITMLRDYGLRYDILILERQIPPAIELVDRHPNQIFILDHIAKPIIRQNRLEPWASQFRELARRPNVYCKISGMATEADWHTWTPEQLAPYFQTVLGAFGPKRLMFGSDWPVCLVAATYQRWVDVVRNWVSPLSDFEQERIWGGTAIEAYGLS